MLRMTMLLGALLIVSTPASGQFIMSDAGPRVDSIMAWAEAHSASLRNDLDGVRRIRPNTTRSLVITTPGSVHVDSDFVIPEELLAATVHNDERLAVVVIDMEKVERFRITDEELLHALIHEVYGHATFVLLNNGKACPDPNRGEAYRKSCVAHREARVIEELGLIPRNQYAIRTRK